MKWKGKPIEDLSDKELTEVLAHVTNMKAQLEIEYQRRGLNRRDADARWRSKYSSS